MPLTAQAPVFHCGGPNVRTTDAYDDIDTFFDRVDETVGKRNVREQQRMFLGKSQNNRKCLQAAECTWKVNANPSTRLSVFGK